MRHAAEDSKSPSGPTFAKQRWMRVLA